MFELQILLANVAAPLAILLIGYLAIPGKFRPRAMAFVLAVCSGLAIWVALSIRNGFTLWPEDAWQKVPAVSMIVTVVALLADGFRKRSSPLELSSNAAETQTTTRVKSKRSVLDLIHGVALAVIVAAGTWLIYPHGEAWAELQDQQSQWCIVLALTASLCFWGIAGCQPIIASTVGLATIPLLIASAYLSSLSMMKVTEPLIAIATVIGVCSLADLFLSGRRSLPIMIAPTLFAMSGFIAHANFQSYLNLPRTLYFLAILSPAIIALVARMTQRKSTQFAIGVSTLLALLLASSISTWGYFAAESTGPDGW